MKSAIFCLWCACACVSCRPTQTGISPSAISNDPELSTLTADMGRSTNVIAVGEWSKPVKDAEGYVLRGRLLLFDTAHYSNQPPGTAITEWWGNAPLFLELQNLSPRTGEALAVYFALGDGLECELSNAKGKRIAFDSRIMSYTGILRPWARQYWAVVPFGGAVRLRADPQLGGTSPKPNGLVIQLNPNQRWLIPVDGTDSYLSGNFSPPTNHPTPPGSHVWQGKLILPPMKISAPKQ